MWETWTQSLGWENPLEEGMATHSSILAWRIPMDRGDWWAAIHGVAKSRTRLSDQAQHSTLVVKNPPANAGDKRDLGSIPGLGRSAGGGHGNPFWYSCLENPHAQEPTVGLWSAVNGATKSWTQVSDWAHTHVFQLCNPGELLSTPCLYFLTCKMGII